MKTIVLFFISMFFIGCAGNAQNDTSKTVIEYTASTRGFYQKITIDSKVVTISNDREGAEKPITSKIKKSDWKELIAFVQNIKLDSLEALKAPTQKRTYDGAAMANLKIEYKNIKYKTSTFDHGHPPEAIKKLITKINLFAKK